ncbi:MAG: PAS domain S-box protein [Pelobacteraceae bacterium]
MNSETDSNQQQSPEPAGSVPQQGCGQAAIGTFNRYGMAIALVIAAAAMRLTILQALGTRYVFTVFYPAVMLAALYGGVWSGLLATVISALLASYFWMEPVEHFSLKQPVDLLALTIFFLSGTLISVIAEAMHRAQARAHKAEIQTHVSAERELSTLVLQESEDRLKSVLQSSSMGTFEVDLQSGAGRWNEVEFELLGLKPGEVVSNPDVFFRYVHPDDIASVTAQWEEALQSGVLDTEFRIVRADGEERWLAGKGRFAFENKAGGRAIRFMGVNFDITGRKQAELELVETQQRLRAIMEAVPVGISYSDDPTCRNVRGNPAVLAQFETKQEDNLSASAIDSDAPGRQVRFFRQGKQISDVELPLQRAVAENREIEPMELEIEMPGGRRWFAEASGAPIRDRDGNVIGGVAVTVDITKRKQVEEQLAELSQRLSYHIDNSPLAVIEWGPDMRLIRWSGAAEHMFGWKADEVLGKRMEDLHWIYAEDEEQVAEVSSDLLKGTNRRRFSANRNYCKDGSVVFCEWYNSSLLDGLGNLRSILSLVLNVTDRRRLEESLQQYSEMLESMVVKRTAQLREKDQLLLQQSRLAAMGEMINNIAHQWRQPLNSLGLHIQRLSLFYDTGHFNKEFLDKSVQESMKLVQHMSQTIDDFRSFFKPDKEKIDFCINRALQQALNLVNDSFEHNQIRVIHHADGEAWINGYPNEFSQALLNILQNARDALLDQKTDGRHVTIGSSVENGKSIITIADNGGGIPEDILEAIFEPYVSTKGIQGTGIGLYMSKIIIEKNMGGSLTVRNRGDGAEFRIEI